MHCRDGAGKRAMKPDATRAERGVRYRARRRRGSLAVTVDVSTEARCGLVALGFIDKAEIQDKAAVAAAVEGFLIGAAATARLVWSLYPPDE